MAFKAGMCRDQVGRSCPRPPRVLMSKEGGREGGRKEEEEEEEEEDD